MAAPVYRFGNFELIASRFELRRNRRIVQLERIPMDSQRSRSFCSPPASL